MTIKKLPYNFPSPDEEHHLSLHVGLTRYDPQSNEEDYLDSPTMQLGDKFRPGNRITWHPDHRTRWQWIPKLSKTEHAVSLSLRMNPFADQMQAEDDDISNLIQLTHDSSIQELDLKSMSASEFFLLQQLHRKINETVLSRGPMAEPQKRPFLPHGVHEFPGFDGIEEFSFLTDTDQRAFVRHWAGGHGALLSDHEQHIEMLINHEEWEGTTRTNAKPLDLEIYEISNLATICVAPEVQIARISHRRPYDNNEHGIKQFQIFGIFVSARGYTLLAPAYHNVREYRAKKQS